MSCERLLIKLYINGILLNMILLEKECSEVATEIGKKHRITSSGMMFVLSEYPTLLVFPEPTYRTVHLLGGHGITDRTMPQLAEALPTVDQALAAEAGQVVFLGNGLSSAPLDVARRYQEGKRETPPIVADLFDYDRAEDDLRLLQNDLDRAGLSVFTYMGSPLPETIERLAAMNEAIRAGEVQVVRHFFGVRQRFPTQSIALAVNCWGPDASSLPEQLSMMGPGGVFYGNDFIETPLPSGFERQVLGGKPNYPVKITRTN